MRRVRVVVAKRRDYGGMSQKIDALLFIDLDTAGMLGNRVGINTTTLCRCKTNVDLFVTNTRPT